MSSTQTHSPAGDLPSPVRNSYFYGKMLDVFHFELEQSYFNQKRWLLNRHVAGHGVVCGLDVTLCRDNRSIVVQPGLALDRCGREIIVPTPSSAVSLDPWIARASTPGGQTQPPVRSTPEDGKWVHVCLCYHECESDPEPALGGDCDTASRCSSGSIRERYRIDVCDGKVKTPHPKCHIPDICSNGAIDYAALARFVTRSCATVQDACCIPIANIQLPPLVPYSNQDAGANGAAPIQAPVIDITVRPIVLTNPLLYQLLLCLCGSREQAPCGGGY